MKILDLVINRLSQLLPGRKQSLRRRKEVEVLIAEVRYELHERSSEGADSRRRWNQLLDVPPVHLDSHIIVASAVPGMREAVPPPIAGPPCFEPFCGTRLLENVADVVNQQCLRMLGKLLNHNIFHSEHLLVKLIILLAGVHSFEIFYMVIPGRGNACSNKMSNHGYENIRKLYLPVR